MTYVVTESCIKCKYTDCVEVCPVDCFYEGPEFLVIHPDECIDCGLCEPECPIEAIYADDELPSDQIEFIEINLKLSEVYENITEAKEPLPDAEKYKNIKNKKSFYRKLFIPATKINPPKNTKITLPNFSYTIFINLGITTSAINIPIAKGNKILRLKFEMLPIING